MNPTRKIIHIDMDCFYAAIEMRDRPELKDKPIAVGGDANRRGVLCTCNYEARAYGVKSAMPTAQALKQCPNLVVLPVQIDKYREESKRIQAIFTEYTDLIEPLSLDEAFLDVTDSPHCQGSATWIAQEIRAKIYENHQLTASAGIAPNKMLAKIASDWNKPNGQKVIKPEQVDDFILELPVRKLFGVGPKLEARLMCMNIKTCQDLQQYSLQSLTAQFGTMGQRLFESARGIDNRPVNPNRVRKSISVEKTYEVDLPNGEPCKQTLSDLVIRLNQRIIRANAENKINGLFVKLKFNDFSQTTVDRTSSEVSMALLHQLMEEGLKRKPLPVRLIGIGVRLKEKASLGFEQLKLIEFD